LRSRNPMQDNEEVMDASQIEGVDLSLVGGLPQKIAPSDIELL